MNWENYIKGFISYLQLEKSLSLNSIKSYERDIKKLSDYFININNNKGPDKITTKEIRLFLQDLTKKGLSSNSQSRILSGIKAFYKYLILEEKINFDPTELIEGPKKSMKLPDTLSKDEIFKIIESIDLTHSQGHRNRAILEILYGCGLRVSELINLKLSNWYEKDGFVKVIGKGKKERLTPIGKLAEKYLKIYINEIRVHKKIKKDNKDFIFLNRNGKKLTRVMIFYIIKNIVKKNNIKKKISPHTFRHSFASHLIQGGADLRVVQEMLGHESITTTEIYTHIDREFLREAIISYHPRS